MITADHTRTAIQTVLRNIEQIAEGAGWNVLPTLLILYRLDPPPELAGRGLLLAASEVPIPDGVWREYESPDRVLSVMAQDGEVIGMTHELCGLSDDPIALAFVVEAWAKDVTDPSQQELQSCRMVCAVDTAGDRHIVLRMQGSDEVQAEVVSAGDVSVSFAGGVAASMTTLLGQLTDLALAKGGGTVPGGGDGSGGN